MLPPVMLAVALIKPPVIKLPPVIFAAEVMVEVADINPPVRTLPPVMLPVPETTPAPNSKLPPVILPVVLTGLLPKAAKFATTFELPYVPVIPVSCEPLPINTLPAILPVAVITPAVMILPPVMLAVADTTPPVRTLPPVTFAVTDTTEPK